MRLERSVFSIRPLSFVFQAGSCPLPPGEIRDSSRNFHQKWVCNCPKDSYNLADRAPIAIPSWLNPNAPRQAALTAGRRLTLPATATGGRGPEGAHPMGVVEGDEAPRTMASACRHPRVRIVSRHEDTEFVECLECGEIFDSEEFRDMEIEDTAGTEDLQDDS